MKSEKDIKIFVTYKDKHKIIETDIIKPIQTGRAIADEAFEGMIGDDTGENISAENPYSLLQKAFSPCQCHCPAERNQSPKSVPVHKKRYVPL